jgi:DedD protein
MQENNELSDIVLNNRGGKSSNNKKIILAVATLGIILIIVVMLMSSLTSDGTDNLPQAVLPPQPKAKLTQVTPDEPLFEEVEVIEENPQNNSDLDAIARKLKAESQEEKVQEVKEKPKAIQKKVTKKAVAKTKPAPKAVVKQKTEVATGNYYIQVGSFSKYEPNKKFLQSIKDLGYSYKFHKVTTGAMTLNKVLVGPFPTPTKAKDARRVIRAKIEPGAFLIKL